MLNYLKRFCCEVWAVVSLPSLSLQMSVAALILALVVRVGAAVEVVVVVRRV